MYIIYIYILYINIIYIIIIRERKRQGERVSRIDQQLKYTRIWGRRN